MNYNIQKLKDRNPSLTEQLRGLTYPILGCCQIVHREMGPFLNEYMYQDALEIVLKEQNIEHEREFYFSINFHNQRINHRHYVDFKCLSNVFVECKAVEHIGPEQRQQLWNYMRLTKVSIGILYNFAPIMDECERYYLDSKTNQMYAF